MTYDTRIYLGRLGNLAAIRSPRGTFEASRQRRIATFELGVGGVSVDQMIGGARTYTLNYGLLTRDDWTYLQGFIDGHEGPGPFALLDPGQRNMLHPNISGATSTANSTSGGATGSFQLLGAYDTFNRAAAASAWGTLDTGQAWTVSPAADHAITSTTGTQTLSSVNVLRTATVDIGSTDFSVYADVSLPVASAAGASITQWVCGRWSDASNHYVARLDLTTAGLVTLTLYRRSGGTLSSALGTGTYTAGTGHTAGSVWRVHFTGTGSSLAASAWLRDGASEPVSPQCTATDATLTTGTLVALESRLETGNTSGTVVVSWDYVHAAPAWAALSSSAAYADAGPRVLAATINGAPAASGAIVAQTWPSSVFAYGVPVVAGRALCLSCWVRGGGSDTTTTWLPRLVWRDATGTVVSRTSTGSGAVTTTAGAWTQMFATGIPPAGAVYADWDIVYLRGGLGSDDFEAGVSAWTPTGGTFASSTAQARSGTKSGLLTVSGSPTQAYVRQSAGVAVTPGVSYTVSMWCYSTAGASNLSAAIDWLDSGGSYLSTSAGTASALGAGAWAQRTVTASAPAGAAFAVYGPTLGGSPANGTAIYLDDVTFSGTGVTSVAYFRRFMLNEGSTPDATWAAGTGVWPISVVAAPESWPFLSPELRISPTVVLAEDVS